jgi:DNA-binding NarL/FixJ family response regulator
MLSKESSIKPQSFTRREREILNLIVEGCQNNEIAEYLHVSLKTVKNHLGKLASKSTLHDISSTIEYALAKGLISISYA